MEKYSLDNLIFDVPESKDEIVKVFAEMVSSNEQNIINFVNPEIFMEAKNNAILYEHIKTAKHNFIDGNGLLRLINSEMKTSYDSTCRYPGTDFFDYLPADREIKIFLYGASEENSKKAAELIHKQHQNITICGRFNGYVKIDDSELIERINAATPDIVIVCFGCPRQEEWIAKNKTNIQCKIIFGNGGSIDFWSGNVKRAPQFFIKHRIEFIYRLFQDFNIKRIKRQMKLFGFVWNMKRHVYKVEKY